MCVSQTFLKARDCRKFLDSPKRGGTREASSAERRSKINFAPFKRRCSLSLALDFIFRPCAHACISREGVLYVGKGEETRSYDDGEEKPSLLSLFFLSPCLTQYIRCQSQFIWLQRNKNRDSPRAVRLYVVLLLCLGSRKSWLAIDTLHVHQMLYPNNGNQ